MKTSQPTLDKDSFNHQAEPEELLKLATSPKHHAARQSPRRSRFTSLNNPRSRKSVAYLALASLSSTTSSSNVCPQSQEQQTSATVLHSQPQSNLSTISTLYPQLQNKKAGNKESGNKNSVNKASGNKDTIKMEVETKDTLRVFETNDSVNRKFGIHDTANKDFVTKEIANKRQEHKNSENTKQKNKASERVIQCKESADNSNLAENEDKLSLSKKSEAISSGKQCLDNQSVKTAQQAPWLNLEYFLQDPNWLKLSKRHRELYELCHNVLHIPLNYEAVWVSTHVLSTLMPQAKSLNTQQALEFKELLILLSSTQSLSTNSYSLNSNALSRTSYVSSTVTSSVASAVLDDSNDSVSITDYTDANSDSDYLDTDSDKANSDGNLDYSDADSCYADASVLNIDSVSDYVSDFATFTASSLTYNPTLQASITQELKVQDSASHSHMTNLLQIFGLPEHQPWPQIQSSVGLNQSFHSNLNSLVEGQQSLVTQRNITETTDLEDLLQVRWVLKRGKGSPLWKYLHAWQHLALNKTELGDTCIKGETKSPANSSAHAQAPLNAPATLNAQTAVQTHKLNQITRNVDAQQGVSHHHSNALTQQQAVLDSVLEQPFGEKMWLEQGLGENKYLAQELGTNKCLEQNLRVDNCLEQSNGDNKQLAKTLGLGKQELATCSDNLEQELSLLNQIKKTELWIEVHQELLALLSKLPEQSLRVTYAVQAALMLRLADNYLHLSKLLRGSSSCLEQAVDLWHRILLNSANFPEYAAAVEQRNLNLLCQYLLDYNYPWLIPTCTTIVVDVPNLMQQAPREDVSLLVCNQDNGFKLHASNELALQVNQALSFPEFKLNFAQRVQLFWQRFALLSDKWLTLLEDKAQAYALAVTTSHNKVGAPSKNNVSSKESVSYKDNVSSKESVSCKDNVSSKVSVSCKDKISVPCKDSVLSTCCAGQNKSFQDGDVSQHSGHTLAVEPPISNEQASEHSFEHLSKQLSSAPAPQAAPFAPIFKADTTALTPQVLQHSSIASSIKHLSSFDTNSSVSILSNQPVTSSLDISAEHKNIGSKLAISLGAKAKSNPAIQAEIVACNLVRLDDIGAENPSVRGVKVTRLEKDKDQLEAANSVTQVSAFKEAWDNQNVLGTWGNQDVLENCGIQTFNVTWEELSSSNETSESQSILEAWSNASKQLDKTKTFTFIKATSLDPILTKEHTENGSEQQVCYCTYLPQWNILSDNRGLSTSKVLDESKALGEGALNQSYAKTDDLQDLLSYSDNAIENQNTNTESYNTNTEIELCTNQPCVTQNQNTRPSQKYSVHSVHSVQSQQSSQAIHPSLLAQSVQAQFENKTLQELNNLTTLIEQRINQLLLEVSPLFGIDFSYDVSQGCCSLQVKLNSGDDNAVLTLLLFDYLIQHQSLELAKHWKFTFNQLSVPTHSRSSLTGRAAIKSTSSLKATITDKQTTQTTDYFKTEPSESTEEALGEASSEELSETLSEELCEKLEAERNVKPHEAHSVTNNTLHQTSFGQGSYVAQIRPLSFVSQVSAVGQVGQESYVAHVNQASPAQILNTKVNQGLGQNLERLEQGSLEHVCLCKGSLGQGWSFAVMRKAPHLTGIKQRLLHAVICQIEEYQSEEVQTLAEANNIAESKLNLAGLNNEVVALEVERADGVEAERLIAKRAEAERVESARAINGNDCPKLSGSSKQSLLPKLKLWVEPKLHITVPKLIERRLTAKSSFESVLLLPDFNDAASTMDTDTDYLLYDLEDLKSLQQTQAAALCFKREFQAPQTSNLQPSNELLSPNQQHSSNEQLSSKPHSSNEQHLRYGQQSSELLERVVIKLPNQEDGQTLEITGPVYWIAQVYQSPNEWRTYTYQGQALPQLSLCYGCHDFQVYSDSFEQLLSQVTNQPQDFYDNDDLTQSADCLDQSASCLFQSAVSNTRSLYLQELNHQLNWPLLSFSVEQPNWTKHVLWQQFARSVYKKPRMPMSWLYAPLYPASVYAYPCSLDLALVSAFPVYTQSIFAQSSENNLELESKLGLATQKLKSKSGFDPKLKLEAKLELASKTETKSNQEGDLPLLCRVVKLDSPLGFTLSNIQVLNLPWHSFLPLDLLTNECCCAVYNSTIGELVPCRMPDITKLPSQETQNHCQLSVCNVIAADWEVYGAVIDDVKAEDYAWTADYVATKEHVSKLVASAKDKIPANALLTTDGSNEFASNEVSTNGYSLELVIFAPNKLTTPFVNSNVQSNLQKDSHLANQTESQTIVQLVIQVLAQTLGAGAALSLKPHLHIAQNYAELAELGLTLEDLHPWQHLLSVLQSSGFNMYPSVRQIMSQNIWAVTYQNTSVDLDQPLLQDIYLNWHCVPALLGNVSFRPSTYIRTPTYSRSSAYMLSPDHMRSPAYTMQMMQLSGVLSGTVAYSLHEAYSVHLSKKRAYWQGRILQLLETMPHVRVIGVSCGVCYDYVDILILEKSKSTCWQLQQFFSSRVRFFKEALFKAHGEGSAWLALFK